MPVDAESCIKFVCAQAIATFFISVLFGFFRRVLSSVEQLQPSLDPAHTVWTESHWIRPSSLQKTSSTGLSAASCLMRWCWQIFHTHCHTIRSDAIRFAALKRCIWRSLQTEGSVCLMQRAWRTCFSSTKAADDKFSSSPFRFLSWLHTCLPSLSSPRTVPGYPAANQNLSVVWLINLDWDHLCPVKGLCSRSSLVLGCIVLLLWFWTLVFLVEFCIRLKIHWTIFIWSCCQFGSAASTVPCSQYLLPVGGTAANLMLSRQSGLFAIKS